MPGLDAADHEHQHDHQDHHNADNAHGHHPNPDDPDHDCNDADKPGYYYQQRTGERWGWSRTRQQRQLSRAQQTHHR